MLLHSVLLQVLVSFTDVEVRLLSGPSVFKWFSRLPLSDSKAYNFKCPLFVPRLLSGRCHDGAHTASNLVYQDGRGFTLCRSRSYS